MTDYTVEFHVDSRFPSGAKQWLADQKIFHHAESLRITGGDEVSAVEAYSVVPGFAGFGAADRA